MSPEPSLILDLTACDLPEHPRTCHDTAPPPYLNLMLFYIYDMNVCMMYVMRNVIKICLSLWIYMLLPRLPRILV